MADEVLFGVRGTLNAIFKPAPENLWQLVWKQPLGIEHSSVRDRT
jgi:hypothetical protein